MRWGRRARAILQKRVQGRGAWADLPHFPFLARECRLPVCVCVGGRTARRALRGSRALRSPTPQGSQAPTSLDYCEQWGRRDGESLNCRRRKQPDQKPRGPSERRPRENWEGGVHGLTCSGVCRQGGDGVPRRTGEALSARFRIPPCFWVRLLQEARFPLGPKAHCSGCRLTLPSYYTSPHLVKALRTEGGKGIHC